MLESTPAPDSTHTSTPWCTISCAPSGVSATRCSSGLISRGIPTLNGMAKRYRRRFMIRAVVFDFDGLILDTETPVFTAWQDAFAAHGTELTIEEWAQEVGTVDGLDLVGMLQERATVAVDVDAMHVARQARRDELLALE